MMLGQEEMIDIKVAEKTPRMNAGKTSDQGINMMCKGCKFTGNIVVSQDLHLDGELEGNITAENNANIFIKGTCKGNIDAKGGSVVIDGEISKGNITAGGNVTITGKFLGGKILAKDKIHINGEFTGSLESTTVELGESARGKGEISYRETLTIQKGSKIEGKVSRVEERPVVTERIPLSVPEQKPAGKEEPKRKGFFAS